MDELFSRVNSKTIAELIKTAGRSVVYAAPGIQLEPAKAVIEVARQLEPGMISVSVDMSEWAFRMGYGSIEAVQMLRDAGIDVEDAPGLRAALVLVDDQGYTFTPNALYLEAEADVATARNAIRLSSAQVNEARARLSPASKPIAVAHAGTEEERTRIWRCQSKCRRSSCRQRCFRK